MPVGAGYVWQARRHFRFNKGEKRPRPGAFQPWRRFALLRRQLAFYPNLAAVADELIRLITRSSLRTSAA